MIASLWPVESTLTRRSHHRLHSARPAVATPLRLPIPLALAVRKHLDGPTAGPLLHPRFWAALAVLGDGSIEPQCTAESGQTRARRLCQR